MGWKRDVRRFALYAREELIRGVEARLAHIGLTVKGKGSQGVSSSSGVYIAIEEQGQRNLIAQEITQFGLDYVVRRAASVWFTRLIAMRYMEVNDLLPQHIRLFSSPDGSFDPECLSRVFDLEMKALNTRSITRYVQVGDDASILREVLLAQCDELSSSMPFLFEQTGDAYDLLLPDGLLRKGGLLEKMVCDIDENAWSSNVEVLAYLFEGYAEGERQCVQKSGRREYRLECDELVVMSQTTTAGWPGRFLVDNTLGRLLQSSSQPIIERDSCAYLIDVPHSDVDHFEIDLQNVSVVDFACGSGMLLAYAFDLLMEAYSASGYSIRDAVKLIVESNLMGFEAEERAACFASLVLCMKACKHDRRFLRRGVEPQIVCLESVEFTDKELLLCPSISERPDLIDVLAHLGECGALFAPLEEDIQALKDAFQDLREERASVARDEIVRKVSYAIAAFQKLSAKHDVVLCDAPRTDAKRLSRWLARWILHHYPNDRHFLPAAFIDRSISALKPNGYAGAYSSSALLFSGKAVEFRRELLDRAHIVCLVETTDSSGLRWSSDAGWVLSVDNDGSSGVYIRLNQHPSEKKAALTKAIVDSECGFVYCRNQGFFSRIPGCPIAYWAPQAIERPFSKTSLVSSFGQIKVGISTGNSGRFLRQWYELSECDRGWDYHCFLNGGQTRKWFGNFEQVIRWGNDGEEVKRSYSVSSLCMDSHFKRGIVWGSGLNFRLLDTEECMIGGMGIILPLHGLSNYMLGLLNSSSFALLYKAVNSDANATSGEIGCTPAIVDGARRNYVETLVVACVSVARIDYCSAETSQQFCRHPMV